jgi:2-polyprenyl-3-methyl-5-hydroxy-6-metoxy-1,4-benzoquinol methylase
LSGAPDNHTFNAPKYELTYRQGGSTMTNLPAEPSSGRTVPRFRSESLSARLEPFDSYWQAPDDIESGYTRFAAYYRHNYLQHLPNNRRARILVISCGPGYLVDVLKQAGYDNVVGIDSDADKVEHARRRGLNCRIERAFEFLYESDELYDVIIPEQELNHLDLEETLEFLRLVRRRLDRGGRVIVYGLNGANPLVGSENLAHNIDHFYTLTEYSLSQILGMTGFSNIRPMPLKLYVFWKNPANYVGLAATWILEFGCRIIFMLYGKKVRVLSKKIMAVADVS